MGAGQPNDALAMQAVDRRLVRREDPLIRLLDPPFDKSDLDPGYIKGYVPECGKSASIPIALFGQ